MDKIDNQPSGLHLPTDRRTGGMVGRAIPSIILAAEARLLESLSTRRNSELAKQKLAAAEIGNKSPATLRFGQGKSGGQSLTQGRDE